MADQICWIFINNSNFFMEESQRHYVNAKKSRMRHEPRFRIDYGKLINQVRNGAQIKEIQLYGTEPSPFDTLWRKLEDARIDVDIFKKDAKEKTDPLSITLDVGRCALQNKLTNPDSVNFGTFIILTSDYISVRCLQTILEDGFKVVIASYKRVLARNIKDLAAENSKLSIIYIDDILQMCSFLSNF